MEAGGEQHNTTTTSSPFRRLIAVESGNDAREGLSPSAAQRTEEMSNVNPIMFWLPTDDQTAHALRPL